jgi:hypothetical protein
MAYIPFNNGMVVCHSCDNEWERLGAPMTILEYHQAIAGREDYRSGTPTRSDTERGQGGYVAAYNEGRQ